MPDASHSHSRPDWKSELIALAADPDIQREMRRIEAEFMGTEMDGLNKITVAEFPWIEE